MATATLLGKQPERVVEKAVRGMLPKNTLGRQMLRKLKVYAGPDHPHQAQQPVPFEITQVAQERCRHQEPLTRQAPGTVPGRRWAGALTAPI